MSRSSYQPHDRSDPATATREVMVIDQAPLIEDALDACLRARGSIEKLKAELRRFESEDLPAYERWLHASFGTHLTAQRELASVIRDREDVLARARKRHWARFFGAERAFHSEAGLGREAASAAGMAGAYAAWGMHEIGEDERDDGPDEYGPGYEESRYAEDDYGYYDDERGSHYDEDEESLREFEELFVRGSAWRNAGYRSRSNDEDRWRRAGARRGPGARPGSAGARAGGEPEEEHPPSQAAAAFRTRLKERYRVLARKLHPDVNPGLTAEEKSLWNQVQTAYHAANLEQLDLLLALSDAFTGRISGSTSVHQLRRAALEIERLVAPLRRKVDEARKNRAWRFSELSDRGALYREVEHELQRDLARLRQKRGQVEELIARFTRRGRERRSGRRSGRNDARAETD